MVLPATRHRLLGLVAAALLMGCGAAGPSVGSGGQATAAPAPTSSSQIASDSVASPSTAATSASPAGPSLPTPGPEPAGAAFPVGRFYGSPDQPIDLLPSGDAYIADDFATLHDRYTVTGDQVVFRGESCDGAVGTYRWALSKDGLSLTKLDDGCLARLGRLVLPLTAASPQLPFVSVLRDSAQLDQPDFGLSAVDAAGTFWTVDGGSGLYHYSADGSVLGSWNAFSYAVGVATDGAGDVFVSNFDDATIHVLDQGGNELRHWIVDGGKVGPVGLATDASGRLFVALHRVHDHYVEVYRADGVLLETLVPHGAGPGQAMGGPSSGPEDLAVDPAGDTWLTDPVDNRIVEVDGRGRPLRTLTGEAGGARVVAVDRAGDLYTMNARVIRAYSPTGRPMGAWFSPYDANLVFDAAGNPFLVDQHITAIALPRG